MRYWTVKAACVASVKVDKTDSVHEIGGGFPVRILQVRTALTCAETSGVKLLHNFGATRADQISGDLSAGIVNQINNAAIAVMGITARPQIRGAED